MSESTPNSGPASGDTTPEPTSKPKKSKSLLVMVAAIIIALILISVVFLAVDWGGDDTPDVDDDDDDDDDDDGGDDVPAPVMEVIATATPPGPVIADAGETVMVYVSSVLKNVNTSESTSYDGEANVTYKWGRSPITLGELDSTAGRFVNLTAADVASSGTLYCNVSYVDEGQYDVVSVDVTVNAPYLTSVSVTPVTDTLLVGDTGVFEAEAYDSVDGLMSEGVSFAWTVWGMDASDYTLNSTTGYIVEFTPLAMISTPVSLNVTATSGDIDVEGTSTITVTDVAGPERTVDYYWYDMFEVPFGEWFEWRDDEVPWSYDAPPYIYNWTGSEIDNIWMYSMMRMDITGAYMDEINMNSNPVFLPQLGTTSGGTAVLDWDMTYITYDEASEWNNVKNWYDGWISIMTGTTTLDYDAAMSVIGMPSDQWDTFDTWWTGAQDTVVYDWNAWLDVQGNEVYDIWTMYEWQLQTMVVEIDAVKVGETIELSHRLVSWGFEALMARWLCAAFMDDNEWYMEDFNMVAEIGPETTNLSISTAVEYAAYAYETTDDGIECWMWEALLGDYMTTADAPDDDWTSRYDVYADKTYVNLAPGSVLYGTDMIYDYTPGIFNLSEGETLSFTWPEGDQMFVHHIAPGDYSLVYGPMTVDYAEPMGTDFPGQITIDTDSRLITYEGPIDMFAWSRDQTRAVNLASEWDRLGLLPYGVPTLEFRLDSALRSVAEEGLTAPAPDAVDLAPVASSTVSSSVTVPEAVAGASASSEIAALTAVVVAAFMVLMALGQCVRRPGNKR